MIIVQVALRGLKSKKQDIFSAIDNTACTSISDSIFPLQRKIHTVYFISDSLNENQFQMSVSAYPVWISVRHEMLTRFTPQI